MESLRPDISPIDKLHNGEELTFWHLLPWFTRDQDSQFRKVFEWRDNTLSNAESPALIQEQAMLVMRSVIEPEIKRESDLLIKQAGLTQERKDNVRRCEVMSAVLSEDKARIKMLCKGLDSDPDLDELHLSELEKRYEAQVNTPTMNTDVLERLSEFQRKRDELFAEYRTHSDQYTMSLQVYEQKKRELEQYEKEMGESHFSYSALDEITEAAQRHPTREYCCVPLEVAKEEGCALAIAHTKPFDFQSISNLSKGVSSKDELTHRRTLLSKYHAVLISKKRRIDLIAEQLQQAEKDMLSYRSQAESLHLVNYRYAAQRLEAISRLEARNRQLTTVDIQGSCTIMLLF